MSHKFEKSPFGIRIFGGTMKGFGLGFCVDRYSLNIDFLWFWAGVEW